MGQAEVEREREAPAEGRRMALARPRSAVTTHLVAFCKCLKCASLPPSSADSGQWGLGRHESDQSLRHSSVVVCLTAISVRLRHELA